jgi:hypothetical protein
MQDNNTADSWQAAWDDAQSDQQHTGSAIKAGLPTTAVNKEPPDVLTLVHHIGEKHISMKPHERIATALWILYTHIARRFTFSAVGRYHGAQGCDLPVQPVKTLDGLLVHCHGFISLSSGLLAVGLIEA